MSVETILIFLGRDGAPAEWLSIVDDQAAAPRQLMPDLQPPTGPRRIALAVPGEKVSIHWLDLPAGLTSAQSAAAARLLALEISAEPIADMHVASGRENEAGTRRSVALVRSETMAAWLASAAAAGIDPDLVLPEPLLIPASDGLVRYDGRIPPIFRGQEQAFAIEPELLAHMDVGTARAIDDAEFEAGLAEMVAIPEIDLRQGVFAKRRHWQWKFDAARMRRLAALAITLVAVTLFVQMAAILRYTYAADRLEAETLALTGGRDLEARLGSLGGAGRGYAAFSSILLGAVQQTPNVELGAIAYEGGTLRATILADAPATVVALGQRIEASGYAIDTAPPRIVQGRQTAEIVVRAR